MKRNMFYPRVPTDQICLDRKIGTRVGAHNKIADAGGRKRKSGVFMLLSPKKFNAPYGFSATRKIGSIGLPIALSGIIWLIAACALNTPSQSPVSNRPETKIIDARPSVVMKALVRVLAVKKFKVNPERTNQQNLETEWLQDGSYRSMVQAEVLPLGNHRSQLKVTLLLQKKAFFQENWQPTDQIDKTVYSEFMNDVLIESYRVLYDRL